MNLFKTKFSLYSICLLFINLLILKFLSNSISNGTSFFASKRYHKINLDEHVKEGLKNQLSLIDIQVDGVFDI